MIPSYVPNTDRAPAPPGIPRRGISAGGPAYVSGVNIEGPGQVDCSTWGDPNTAGIGHERIPFRYLAWMPGNTDALVDWTRAGPARPTLRMLQRTLDRQIGTSNTRAQDPMAVPSYGTRAYGHGMRSMPPPGKTGNIANYRSRAQQQPARQDRLSRSRYLGQSYSQTTQIQGGG